MENGLDYGLDHGLDYRTSISFSGLPTVQLIAYSLVPKFIQVPMNLFSINVSVAMYWEIFELALEADYTVTEVSSLTVSRFLLICHGSSGSVKST